MSDWMAQLKAIATRSKGCKRGGRVRRDNGAELPTVSHFRPSLNPVDRDPRKHPMVGDSVKSKQGITHHITHIEGSWIHLEDLGRTER